LAKADNPGHPADILMDFGDYQLLEEIGRGGQGVVYRARQKSLNRTVALKVIGLGSWATTAHLKRFRLEAEAAASLDHPCIVPIYEVGEREGSCYFSMKFIDGGQLDEVAKRRPISTRNAAELIAKLARTVQHAHEHGILHRDIKPGNVLLDQKGEPHLTDFGLARLVEMESTVTRTMDVMGTPAYMAPEQAAGQNEQLTSATDVYGLGAVFYQLLTGHPPFAGATTYETVRLVLETEPRQPRLWNRKIDRDLATICLKCLEKDPNRRYSSALRLVEDLEHWLKHEPIRAKRSGLFTHARKWVRRNPSTTVLVTLLVALAAGLGVMTWRRESEKVVEDAKQPIAPEAMAQAPDKSIAVLPFEDLSANKEHAFFADGVQDDVLTKLAKVADLKVISRTSVMQYRGKQDLRQIGRALGVSHLLEGTLRRFDGKVHINAQLVDARTDTHVWAEEYDRDLNEVFAIETELAQSIANQLRAKISASENLAMQERSTADLVAFDLYTRAKNLLLATNFSSTARMDLLRATDLLKQAVAHDPSFFQAHCLLAYTHDLLYSFGVDHTPARLALAQEAIDAAFRLRPDSGEAHLARAENLFRGYLDYDRALADLEIAGHTLPNDSRVFELKAYVQRRQGRWDQATRNLKQVVELEPRDPFTMRKMAWHYLFLRRYAEEKSMLERALSIEPNDVTTKARYASAELEWKADTRPLRQIIDSIRATKPAALPAISERWLICALAERDAIGAKDALIAAGENPPLTDDAFQFSRPFIEGVIARMIGDDSKVRSAFTDARAQQEKIVLAQPNYGPPLCVLALIDAGLGRKEDALREGWQALELLPVEKDAINGALMIEYSAMIAAWVGEKDLACKQLAAALRFPGPLSYGQLKLLPFWDPLRGDPRFENTVASLAPK
jgi:TolB-like protein/Tfp pilus assembly protein PilF/predicted Ser/Thr protein kinase